MQLQRYSVPKVTVLQSCLVTLFTCETLNAVSEGLEIGGLGFVNKNVRMAQTSYDVRGPRLSTRIQDWAIHLLICRKPEDPSFFLLCEHSLPKVVL